MKTFSVTHARANLSALLKKAKQGEDIGIICGNQIIQLKSISLVAWEDSYAYREYGITPDEWEQFRARMAKRRKKERYANFSKEFGPKLIKSLTGH